METTRAENPIMDRYFATHAAPYTEADIAADLSAKALLLLEMLRSSVMEEAPDSTGALAHDKAKLEKYGFTSSRNIEYFNQIQKRVEGNKRAEAALLYMEDVWRTLGTDVIVLRYDHFYEILEKYDMVCGGFDRYTGVVPQYAIDVLDRLRGMNDQLGRLNLFPFKSTLDWSVSLVKVDASELEDLMWFLRAPFAQANPLHTAPSSGLTRPRQFFIAAPAADMKPMRLSIDFDTPLIMKLKGVSRYSAIDRTKYGKEVERLQRRVIKAGIGRYAELDFSKNVLPPERLVPDPFICSLTEHGVLIHAKWGQEAEDATIKRYEELRDTVIQTRLR